MKTMTLHKEAVQMRAHRTAKGKTKNHQHTGYQPGGGRCKNKVSDITNGFISTQPTSVAPGAREHPSYSTTTSQKIPPSEGKTRMTDKRLMEHRAAMPSKYRKLFDRVTSGRASPREAIKLNCLECCGYVRNEIVLCNDLACALYAYRPYQKLVKSPTEAVQRSSNGNQAGKV